MILRKSVRSYSEFAGVFIWFAKKDNVLRDSSRRYRSAFMSFRLFLESMSLIGVKY